VPGGVLALCTLLSSLSLCSTPPIYTMRLGHNQGNFIGLEFILPHTAVYWQDEDTVIHHLIENDLLRAGLVEYIENLMDGRFDVVYIHHMRLFIPVWYRRGEGQAQFALRLRERRWAGEVMGMVRPPKNQCLLAGIHLDQQPNFRNRVC
jgi:hypothetical protein